MQVCVSPNAPHRDCDCGYEYEILDTAFHMICSVCFVGCLKVRPRRNWRNSKPFCATLNGSRGAVSLTLRVTRSHSFVDRSTDAFVFCSPRAHGSHHLHQTVSAASAPVGEVRFVFTHSIVFLFSQASKRS